ncbi:hypothetical protein LTR66_002006 [Elasticomyces elasticus]|nr:hypothetical protein LTR66_002006 [Elasticomyces elasticus]
MSPTDKRLWLRPGTKHLFGRTKPDPSTSDQGYHIDNKSVSRKHLVVEVAAVKSGDGVRLHERSRLTITDDSKIGTHLDGEQFVKSTKTLKGNKHVVKLGRYEQVLRYANISLLSCSTCIPRLLRSRLSSITWHPVTLTLSTLSRKVPDSAQLKSYLERLEILDVKCAIEYIVAQTSHVVAAKRNTPKCLQALINGKCVVVDSYIDAIVVAAAPRTVNGEPTPSLLETDFDANWPNASEFLPGVGKEPVPRPAELFRPDVRRQGIFRGYTFVFLDDVQLAQLVDPVENGEGKALLYPLKQGETTTQELVDYMRSVAGKKGTGPFRETQPGIKGGAVLVRLGDEDQWANTLRKGVDLALDQRSINQNEFLDAIVMCDASQLRQPLPEDDGLAASAIQTNSLQGLPINAEAVQVPSSPPQGESAQPEASVPAAVKRRGRRTITQPRFKGFDEFDPSQIIKPSARSPSLSPMDEVEHSQDRASATAMDDSQPAVSRSAFGSAQTQQSTKASRKRPLVNTVEEQEEETEDVVDGLLQGAAAMKRRRIEERRMGTNAFSESASSKANNADTAGSAAKKPIRKKEKQVDVMAVVNERREEEEERRRLDEETLRDALDSMDIAQIRNLAQIEEMEIIPRTHANNGFANDQANGRWEERWNGRKNFKQFRKAVPGTAHEGQSELSRRRGVIVGLEEVKKKDFGIGVGYWLTPSSTSQNRRDKRGTPSQSQGLRVRDGQDGSSENEKARFQRRMRNSREEDAADADQAQVLPEEIAGTARDEGINNAVHGSGRTQTRTSEQNGASTSRAAGKRPARDAVGEAPAAKKPRQSGLAPPPVVIEGSESDGEDELKFRRRRR